VLVLSPVRFISVGRWDCIPATARAAKPRTVNVLKSMLKSVEID
jgi:hypothetical protein